MDTMRLSIVTPNGEIFNDNVKTVTLPGKEGEFGVLYGHSSLVSSLNVGVIVIEKPDSKEEVIAINWGYVKVTENSVDVLANGAIALTKTDSSQTAKNIAEAKKLVNSVKDTNVSIASVEAKINSFV